MATNEVYEHGDYLPMTVGASVDAGTPMAFAAGLAGVTLTDTGSSGTQIATVAFKGVFDLSVKGIDGSGNSAVAVGDQLYCVNADTPKVSKKATGAPIGQALETVGSGLTATIKVRLG